MMEQRNSIAWKITALAVALIFCASLASGLCTFLLWRYAALAPAALIALTALSAVALSAASGVIFVRFFERTAGKPMRELLSLLSKADDTVKTGENQNSNEMERLDSAFRGLMQTTNRLDELTQTYDRRVGMEALKNALSPGKLDIPYCAAFVDIDDLSGINDLYGHTCGDDAIRAIADTLLHSVREDDIVCRYGGDEFIVVFAGCSKQNAQNILNRVLDKLREVNATGTYPFKLNFSFGIVDIVPGEMLDVRDIIDQMDKIMYEHKDSSRGPKRGSKRRELGHKGKL